jgi:hypothetical protein
MIHDHREVNAQLAQAILLADSDVHKDVVECMVQEVFEAQMTEQLGATPPVAQYPIRLRAMPPRRAARRFLILVDYRTSSRRLPRAPALPCVKHVSPYCRLERLLHRLWEWLYN